MAAAPEMSVSPLDRAPRGGDAPALVQLRTAQVVADAGGEVVLRLDGVGAPSP